MIKKRIIASALALTMAVTSICVGSFDASAAKKVKLSSTSKKIKVGGTFKLSVKNGKKSAKVTWKTSNARIARITKKTTKGNKATATIKGVKKGKAKITASYKLGKKTTKLTCKVSVSAAVSKNATPTPTTAATVATATPTAATTTAAGTATPEPSKEPTKGPTATPKPTQKPTASPDAVIYKTFTDIKVDGTVDNAWDFVDAMPISNWTADADSKKAQTANAYAKVMWTEKYVYILVEAEDSEIDTANEADYKKDSVELFFDEYNNKEEWGSEKKKNEFQYRTVIDDKAEKPGSFTDKNQWDGKEEDVVTAVGKTDKGYVVEYSIALHEAPVVKVDEEHYVGIELQINDASAGDRNGTWNLFANPAKGDKTPYDSTFVFGDCLYAIKTEPKEIELDFSNPDSTDMQLPDQFSKKDKEGNIVYFDEDGVTVLTTRYVETDENGKVSKITYKDKNGNEIAEPIGKRLPNDDVMNTKASYDTEKGLVYCETANNIVIYFPDNMKIYMGEKASIKIEGTYTLPGEGEEEVGESDTVFRTWLVDTNGKTRKGDTPVTTSNQEVITYGEIKADDGKFQYEGTLKATGPDKEVADDGYASEGTCDGLMIKAKSWEATMGNLVLSKVVLTVYVPIEYKEPEKEPENPEEPGEVVTDQAIELDFSAETAHAAEGKPWWYEDPAKNEYAEDGSVKAWIGGGHGIAFYFNKDKTPINVADYSKVVVTLSTDVDGEPIGLALSGDKANLKWDDGGAIVEKRFENQPANTDLVLELDLTGKTGDGYGIIIADRWKKGANFTIKSVKVVK